MRLKQLSGVLVLLLLSAAHAAAAETQLKNVTATAQAGTTTVVLETAGSFTHSEYRPQPSMVLVDLPGVSPSAMKQREHIFNMPEVKGYRVLQYKSVSGVEVTRVELTVADNAKLQVKEGKSGLLLYLTTAGTLPSAPPAAQVAPPVAAPPVARVVPPVAAPPVARVVPPVAAPPVARVVPPVAAPPVARVVPPVAAPPVARVVPPVAAPPVARVVPPVAAPPVARVVPPVAAPPVARVVPPVAAPPAARVVPPVAAPPAARVVPPVAAPPVARVAQPTAPAAHKTKVAAVRPEASGATPASIRNVSVVRTAGGLAVEIEGAKSATSLRLSDPERLVFDIQNSALAGKSRKIEVNAPDLQAVRISRYQLTPPVTRIVLDLPGPREFDLANRSDKLIVTVIPAKTGGQGSAAMSVPVPVPVAAPVFTKPQSAVATVRPINAEKRTGKSSPATQLTVQSLFPGTASVAQPVQKSAAPMQVAAVPESVLSAQPLRQTAAPVAVSAAQPSSALEKKSDYVFVEPVYKKQDPPATPVASARAAAPATPATPVLNPALAKASEAASTVAQNRPAEELTQPKAEAGPQRAVNFALDQQKANAAQHPQGSHPKYTGEPISVNLKDVDLKDFFRLIHEISGLNIVLDPNVRGTLTLVLDDVPWDQALDVVLQNNALGRQLEGNVLRIANLDTFRKEAEQQRAQAEAQALAVNKVTVTRFLSYAHAKDLMPTLKKLLSARGDVLADDRTNALIISDIPSAIPQLDRLLTQLDRKTLEVEIEARVVAATRSFARQLGTQVGFGWGNGSGTAIGGNPTTGTSPNTLLGSTFPYFTIPGPGTSATPQAIPLFSNLSVPGNTSGLNFVTAIGNYRLDVLLSAAENHGLLKVLSRPRVVTQNNVTAVVRQGVRVPVVTQSQLQGPPTTSYVDAFLRLTVTPQITIDNTIFLAVDVENTQPDFSNSVGGNPTLITQQATTQVLVTDGGTVVIGGVILTQNSINVQQVPWLGSVPILGNLFKSKSVSTSTQELMFFISPKIIQT